MKITINTKALKETLNTLIKVIPNRVIEPRLNNMLIMAAMGKTAFLVSDNETALSITVKEDDGTIAVEGVTAVPAKLLAEIVRTIEDDMVTIATDGTSALVSWANGHSQIPLYDGKEFPETTLSVTDCPEITIETGKLSAMLQSVIYAMADDPVRPTLNGVFLEMGENGLTAVATDARRLAIAEMSGTPASSPASFIMPAKAASIAKSVFTESEVTIRYDGKRAVFHSDRTILSIIPEKGKYPDYRNVIPKDNKNLLTVDRETFAETIKRILVCSDKTSNTMKMEIKTDLTGQTVTLSSENIGFMTEAKETLPVDYTGEDIVIGFKGNYLVETLNSLPGERVKMTFDNQKKPVYVTPEEQTDGMERSCVIMPVLVS